MPSLLGRLAFSQYGEVLILDVHYYEAPGLSVGCGVAVLLQIVLNIFPEILVFQSGLHPSTPRCIVLGAEWRD